jgi:hypothetical protein
MRGESSNLNELSDDELSALGKDYGLSNDLQEPYHEQKDSWLVLMRDFKNTKDSVKVANLDASDLLRTRANMRLALFCEYVLPKGKLALWLMDRAEALASTSMGKNCKFLDTTVTQIKKQGSLHTPAIKKKTLFGGTKYVPVEEG